MVAYCKLTVQKYLWSLLFWGLSSSNALSRVIPDEYEEMGGHGISLNNAGVAATDGIAAVRVNPALLGRQKVYNIGGGYHWPAQGREFYQFGIVDGKTSKIAAGVSMTSFPDKYVYSRLNSQGSLQDSPIARRGAVALSQLLGSWSLGFGITYVEGFPLWTDLIRNPEKQESLPLNKGMGANVGVSWSANSQMDIGASLENASNKKISVYLPQTARLGLAYRWSNDIQLLMDFRHRERIDEFESKGQMDFDEFTSRTDLKPEQSMIIGVETRVYDVIRLSGSYGATLDRDQFAAAGAAIVNKSFTLAYGLRRRDLSYGSDHQSLTVSYDLSI